MAEWRSTKAALLGSFGCGHRKRMLAVAGIGAFLIIACGSKRQADVELLARFVTPAMARHLVDDNDREFRAYAASVGYDSLSMACPQLFMAPHSAVESLFVHVESAVAPAYRRLAAVLRDEYSYPVVWNRYAAYGRLPLRDRMQIVRWNVEYGVHMRDTKLTLEDKVRFLHGLIEAARPFEAEFALGDVYAAYAELLPRIEPNADLPSVLRAGIEIAERQGDTIACQMLGQLGTWYATRDDDVAMRACWNRALELAIRWKSTQEPRILTFFAVHYRNRGRLALSREYILRAQARSRALRGGQDELRYLLQYLRFLANLGCWNLVEHELDRAELLLQRARKDAQAVQWETQIRLLKAESAAVRGNCSEAHPLLVESVARLRSLEPSAFRERVRLSVARAFLRCDEYDEADSACAAGSEACRRYHIPETLPDFEVGTARIRVDRDDASGAEAALSRCRDAALVTGDSSASLWLPYDVCGVEAALLAGDSNLAFARFFRGLARAAQQQEQLGASPEAYLAWKQADALRALGHRLLGGDARLGYALEMAWRRMNASGGRAWWPKAVSAPLFLKELQSEASTLEAALAESHAMHCVFQSFDDVVIRWSAVLGHVECDTLDASSQQIAAWVATVRQGLQGASWREPAFLETSARLARVLLPPVVLEASAPSCLLISGDDVLAGLPFGALSTSSDRFEPLIARCDVACVRFHASPGSPASGSPLVVVDPDYASSLRRRFSILQQPLPLASVEAARAGAALPGATVLRGPAATKQAFLSRAVDAPVIYVASHVIQEPEIPYIAFIPLASPDSDQVDESLLELSDIRGADLSRCRLAVLSGCGSGRTYVSTMSSCPSLAEVLVDAGVGAVVHTYEDVKDEDAAALMGEFLEALQRDPDPVRALAMAQRAIHEQGCAPSTWASYSITLGSLTGGSLVQDQAKSGAAPTP